MPQNNIARYILIGLILLVSIFAFNLFVDIYCDRPHLFYYLLPITVLTIIIRPSLLYFGKKDKAKFRATRTGFRLSMIVSFWIVLPLSIASMISAFYVSFVPAIFFALGYTILWLTIPLAATSRAGLRGLIAIPILCFFLAGFPKILPFKSISLKKKEINRKPEITEYDDQLADKNPQYVPAYTRGGSYSHYNNLIFNKSASVIGIDLSDVADHQKEATRKIYPTLNAARKASGELSCEFLPSVDLIDGYTKFFDDRLLAAIEEHIHTGSTIYPGGKQGFLNKLLSELVNAPDKPGKEDAIAHIATAIELGGGTAKISGEERKKVDSYKEHFEENIMMSKPCGFYTQNDTLKKIFRRDRFLQKEFGTKLWGEPHPDKKHFSRERLLPMIRIAEVLQNDENLPEAYSKFRQLAEKVCNPESNLNLEDMLPFSNLFDNEEELAKALLNSEKFKKILKRDHQSTDDAGVAFWPYSYSKETRMINRIYKRTGELPETEIMNDLAAAVKSGIVDLAPDQDSGWYDYQIYALETLVLPEKGDEADKLLLHSKYKKRLREAFEAMYTKRRESHFKQLPLCSPKACEPIQNWPMLSLEPTATNYLRTARAYRFLKHNLQMFFTEKELSSLKIRDMSGNLSKELNNATALFYGFYLTTCNDLGMVPKLRQMEIAELPGLETSFPNLQEKKKNCLVSNTSGLNEDQIKAWISVSIKAKNWLENIKTHKFIDEDSRVIVPVCSNNEGAEVRNWAVLGIRLLKIQVYYAKPPKIAYSNASESNEREQMLEKGNEEFNKYMTWQPKNYVIPVQVFAEVTLGPEPLTRKEFRDICDKHETKEDIVAALQRATLNKIPGWLVTLICLAATAILLFLIRKPVIRKLTSGKKQE